MKQSITVAFSAVEAAAAAEEVAEAVAEDLVLPPAGTARHSAARNASAARRVCDLNIILAIFDMEYSTFKEGMRKNVNDSGPARLGRNEKNGRETKVRKECASRAKPEDERRMAA